MEMGIVTRTAMREPGWDPEDLEVGELRHDEFYVSPKAFNLAQTSPDLGRDVAVVLPQVLVDIEFPEVAPQGPSIPVDHIASQDVAKFHYAVAEVLGVGQPSTTSDDPRLAHDGRDGLTRVNISRSDGIVDPLKPDRAVDHLSERLTSDANHALSKVGNSVGQKVSPPAKPCVPGHLAEMHSQSPLPR